MAHALPVRAGTDRSSRPFAVLHDRQERRRNCSISFSSSLAWFGNEASSCKDGITSVASRAMAKHEKLSGNEEDQGMRRPCRQAPHPVPGLLRCGLRATDVLKITAPEAQVVLVHNRSSV